MATARDRPRFYATLNRRKQCAKRVSRKSRWWGSSARRIAIRFRQWPIGTVSDQTIYSWRKRWGGFGANEVRRLKQLEAENARLKKLVAERDLEIEVMKEVAAKLVSVPARRRQVVKRRPSASARV
jgi:hypothetical protein